MRAAWTWLVACLAVTNWGSAQVETWPPADEVVHELFNAYRPRTSNDFFAIADSLAALNGTCEEQVAERVMRMNGWTFGAPPPQWEAQAALPEVCAAVRCARYQFLLGALHYQDQNWEQAVTGFRTAARLTTDSTFLSEALNNLSAAFSRQGDFPDSVFIAMEQALRFASPAQSPYILNNLAALQIEQKQWERAKQFIDRIRLSDPNIRPNLRFNAQLNHLAIAIRTGRLELARGLVEALDTLPVTAGNECTHARLVSKYYLLAQDYSGYLRTYKAMQEVVNSCEVTPWQTEGLLYQPWRMQRAAEDSLMRPVGQEVWAALCWAEGQLIASEMDFVDSVQLRRAPVETIQETASQPQRSWGWAAAAGLALLAAAGALALLKRRQDAAKALSRRRLRQGLKELRDLGKDDAFIEAIDRLEAEWLDQGTAATLQKVHPELELTSIEEEVLHLLASGRGSKDIARTMDLSVSYVYNIRGRLRKKLDVPDGVDFDDWISKKFGVE